MKMRITKRGFTLIELVVVIVIIGVVAVFAVPRFRTSVERSKASEAFNYLSAIQAAQERCHAKEGTYSGDLAALGIKFSTPKYFNVGAISGDNLKTAWSLTLTRTDNAAGYGKYTVTFTQEGFDSENSTITQSKGINPLQM